MNIDRIDFTCGQQSRLKSEPYQTPFTIQKALGGLVDAATETLQNTVSRFRLAQIPTCATT